MPSAMTSARTAPVPITMQPPEALAGPSKRRPQQSECCKMCSAGLNRQVILEYTPDNVLACSRCGLIDEAATHARNSVSVSDTTGAQVDQYEPARTFERDWGDFESRAEKAFKDEVDGLFHTYLVDPKTSLLGYAAPSLVKPVKMWYLKIRAAEQEEHKLKIPAMNAMARRIPYQVCVAIKFTLQENGIKVVDSQLGRPKTSLAGFVRADARLPMLSLVDIFVSTLIRTSLTSRNRANALRAGTSGHIDRLAYLTKTYRKYSALLRNAVSSQDVCLILLTKCVSRLKEIVKAPHEQRLKMLVTKPIQTKKQREWVEEDWTWFKGINFDDLVKVGYNLYQAQQCASLWGTRCSPQVAVALTMWACMAVVGEPMPQYINTSNEISAIFGQKHWVAAERGVELKNFLIAWTTSIEDAGVPFPKMKRPVRGGLGDGLTFYGSDSRRRIPEMEMAATAARTIADNWMTILRNRIRTRDAAMPLDDEHNLARIRFAKNGERDPIVINTVPRAPIPLFIPTPLQPYPTNARSARPRTTESSPLPHDMSRLAVPPNEKTVEAMIATQDDSSDDGDLDSSDDDQPPRSFGLGLTNLGDKSGPFAFSIGPDGFNVDTSTSFARPTSSSSPVLVSRHHSSSQGWSETAFDSTSEIELMMSSVRREPTPPRYSKTMKRRAEQSAVSRSATPGPIASPASTHASFPVSPALSDDRPLTELPGRVDSDGNHCGQLLREREEYMTYRQGHERLEGRLVSIPLEVAMKKWVQAEKRNGTIPAEFTPEYLATLGLTGDPRKIDMGPWVESLRKKMSPVAALLRAGIRPTELPRHYIIHSLVHLDQQVAWYTDSNALAPIGEKITDAQADAELELLFRTGDETLDDVFLSAEERETRGKQILKAGIWPAGLKEPEYPEDMTSASIKPKATIDELEQIAYAVGSEEEGDSIQEAMLASWWASENGLPRVDGLSDLEDEEEIEETMGRKKATKRDVELPLKRRPVTKTATKKRKSSQGGDSEETVVERPRKGARKKVAASPAPASGIIQTFKE